MGCGNILWFIYCHSFCHGDRKERFVMLTEEKHPDVKILRCRSGWL
jgi:hypothetical protein